ncbi:MAG: 30S ribosomal protein S16 [Phycisphaerales bacterium JB054]
MVRLRLQRFGRRNRPFYRLNAIEKRNRRNGKVLEQLGWYDPIAADPEKQLKLEGERITHWLSQGAQPSETVADLLAKNDLLPPNMKAKWEADRKKASDRTAAIRAAKEAEKAAAEKAAKEAAEAKAKEEAEKAAAAAAEKAAAEAAAAAEAPAAEGE